MTRVRLTWAEWKRFWNRVHVSEKGCWEWTGAKTSTHYGHVQIRSTVNRAHRISYEALVGEIPPSFVVDHKCRNKACVNPSHLEAVSFKENVLRGTSTGATNARKTHCCNGHELTGYNLIPRKGGRRCRECKKTSGREYWRRKAEKKNEQPTN